MTRKPIVSRVGTDAINAHGKGQYMEQSATPKPNEETIKERAAKFDAAHMPTPTPKPRAGEHTKGPWRVDMDSPFIIAAGNGYSVCETTPGNPYDISNEQAQANARRIVAAVNACDGISIGELEALAKMGIKDYANILAKSSHDMEAERDFLVAQNRELRALLDKHGR